MTRHALPCRQILIRRLFPFGGCWRYASRRLKCRFTDAMPYILSLSSYLPPHFTHAWYAIMHISFLSGQCSNILAAWYYYYWAFERSFLFHAFIYFKSSLIWQCKVAPTFPEFESYRAAFLHLITRCIEIFRGRVWDWVLYWWYQRSKALHTTQGFSCTVLRKKSLIYHTT